MFEKEAEERARKLEESQTLDVYNDGQELECNECYNSGEVAGYEEGFIDGAEFGYNKAKEEMQELLKEGVQLLKNSDELYGYQIRDFYLKCKPFIKEDQKAEQELQIWLIKHPNFKIEEIKEND